MIFNLLSIKSIYIYIYISEPLIIRNHILFLIKSIFHGDLKPENIVFKKTDLGNEHEIKVIDFGCSNTEYCVAESGTRGYINCSKYYNYESRNNFHSKK